MRLDIHYTRLKFETVSEHSNTKSQIGDKNLNTKEGWGFSEHLQNLRMGTKCLIAKFQRKVRGTKSHDILEVVRWEYE